MPAFREAPSKKLDRIAHAGLCGANPPPSTSQAQYKQFMKIPPVPKPPPLPGLGARSAEVDTEILVKTPWGGRSAGRDHARHHGWGRRGFQLRADVIAFQNASPTPGAHDVGDSFALPALAKFPQGVRGDPSPVRPWTSRHVSLCMSNYNI